MELSTIILDILKITIPSLIVFLTAYFTLKYFLRNQIQLEQIKLNSSYSDGTRTMKIQAYERLMLFCDRMDIANMTSRVGTSEMSAEELKQALLISLQKEYEHNSAQQIYTSEALWKVITEAKNANIKVIRAASSNMNASSRATDLLKEISKKMEQIAVNPSDQAKSAIRSEASVLLS